MIFASSLLLLSERPLCQKRMRSGVRSTLSLPPLGVNRRNASQLLRVLSRENEQQKALSPQEISRYREQLIEIAPRVEQSQDYGIAI
jgi:hypothetical protein